MARAAAKSTTQSSSLRESGVGCIETWLETRRASVYELQAKLLEALGATESPSQLFVEALRVVAEATSAGWTEADVRSSVQELLACHSETEPATAR